MRSLTKSWLACTALIAGTTLACENDRAVAASPLASATIFASAYFSPAGSNLQSVCFISGTLPSVHWPLGLDTATIPLYVGRELHVVVAPPTQRDTLLPAVAIRLLKTDAKHFVLAFGPPLSNTVVGDLDASGHPLRVTHWRCPDGLPFKGDSDLLSGGYQPDSLFNGYLSVRLLGVS